MRYLLFAVMILGLLAGCAAPSAAPINQPMPEATQEPSAPPALPTLIPSPVPSATPAAAGEPQRIEFPSGDGTPLVGYYYPAATEPAPLVVLMHWVVGNQCDWVRVNLVQWLQNGGLPEGAAVNQACKPGNSKGLSLAQYPPMPEGRSFAVFTFDYRGLGESGGNKGWDREGWRKDSIAAMERARALPGVDPQRVAAIGASIGADGAADGCAEGCLGALSFSPGNYQGMPYADAVKGLDAAGKAAWCVVGKGDGETFPVCDALSGKHFKKFVYEGYDHGMDFFKPGLDPDTGRNILDFLTTVFGE